MPRRMLLVAKKTSHSKDKNPHISSAIAATKQLAIVTLKLIDWICDKNRHITTAHTNKALSTLRLNAIWMQRERFNSALSSVVNDLLKSSSVLTLSLRSNCRARSVIRAKRLESTPNVAAIPVIKKTGATAVWITFAMVRMLITSEFIFNTLFTKTQHTVHLQTFTTLACIFKSF